LEAILFQVILFLFFFTSFPRPLLEKQKQNKTLQLVVERRVLASPMDFWSLPLS